MTDQLHKCLFTDKQTRIQTVFLETVWHKAFEHQAYPDAVKKLLGEFTAAAVLLAGNLKMQGSLILQAQGDGPIKLLVVECTSNLKVRATVHLQDDAIIPKKASLQSLLNPHGSARFSVILEPKGKDNFQPYQGIVPLQNDSVQEVLKEYMKQSEQLDTELCLAANQYRAAGILMQRLPNADASTLSNDEAGKENSWERNIPLFATIEPAELLNID